MSEVNRLEDLERRIEEMAREMESRAQEFSERLEQMGERLANTFDSRRPAAPEEVKGRPFRRRRHDSLFWGLVLIAVGVFWMGRNLGWFWWHVPLWPVLLIALGLYLLLRSAQH